MTRWRTVIIDSIDDLERGAANALLKTLEEPPERTIFLLISHAPGQLLPTIFVAAAQIELLPGGALETLEPGAEIEDTQGAVSLITLLMKFVGGASEDGGGSGTGSSGTGSSGTGTSGG